MRSGTCIKFKAHLVTTFKYLGATITNTGGAPEDMVARIGKAHSAYYRLKKVWNSSQYRRKTKLRILRSNVLSVLLYGCETWKMTDDDERKLDTFVHKCRRRILKVYWPIVMSNDDIKELAGMEKVSTEIRFRRWKYLGHILRKGTSCNEGVALRWDTGGKKKTGETQGD